MARRPLRVVLSGLLLIGLVGCVTARARNDRDWYPYLSHTSDVALANDRFHVAPVSDWRYEAPGPISETYTEASYDISELRRVWFMLEPQPGSTLAAHTLLLFEFEGDRLLGLTIEARRENGEEYSALSGAFNTFELSYVWASARDLLTRRAVMLDHEVFVYPIVIRKRRSASCCGGSCNAPRIWRPRRASTTRCFPIARMSWRRRRIWIGRRRLF
ncbi:MAG: DUF4105 domain-containing protein [Terricaulis sp.]